VPEDLVLGRNRPNPFNPSTTIDFALPEPGWVTLRVYDVDGRLMNSLVDGHRDAGYHSVIWKGDNDGGRSIASGVYIYCLQAGGRTLSRSMTLLK
jgi:flagellar hook assembly protein FlgD